MASEWAYLIARDQLRDVETMATNLDAARAKGRIEGLEEAAAIAANGSEHMCGSLWCNDEVALWCNDEVAHTRGDVAAEIRARITQEQA